MNDEQYVEIDGKLVPISGYTEVNGQKIPIIKDVIVTETKHDDGRVDVNVTIPYLTCTDSITQ